MSEDQMMSILWGLFAWGWRIALSAFVLLAFVAIVATLYAERGNRDDFDSFDDKDR